MSHSKFSSQIPRRKFCKNQSTNSSHHVTSSVPNIPPWHRSWRSYHPPPLLPHICFPVGTSHCDTSWQRRSCALWCSAECTPPGQTGLRTLRLREVFLDIMTGWWLNHPEKYESVGMIIPNIWKNKWDIMRHLFGESRCVLSKVIGFVGKSSRKSERPVVFGSDPRSHTTSITFGFDMTIKNQSLTINKNIRKAIILQQWTID